MAGGFLRRMFPIRISAQAKDVGQRLAMGQKIRLLAHCAQKIQPHHAPRCDQAGKQPLRLLNGGDFRHTFGAPDAGFDKGGCWRRQLRAPRQVKAQGMLFQPALCVFEGKEGALILAPVRRPCCLELLCYQDDSALSKLGRVSLNPVKCPLDFFPSIPQDDGTPMRATGRVLGFGQLTQ